MGRDHHSKRKHRTRSRSLSSEKDTKKTKTTEDKVNFSFLNHKNTFHRLLTGFNIGEQLVNEIQDFWLFVSKYEALLRRNGQSVLDIDFETPSTSSIIPNEYRKGFLMNFKIKPAKHQLSLSDEKGKEVEQKKIKIFLTIITHYLDFKQKERFQKIKKLRKFQANLPIAAFRNEIVEAVKNESILILAGDTGCGKSTQVFILDFKLKKKFLN